MKVDLRGSVNYTEKDLCELTHAVFSTQRGQEWLEYFTKNLVLNRMPETDPSALLVSEGRRDLILLIHWYLDQNPKDLDDSNFEGDNV